MTQKKRFPDVIRIGLLLAVALTLAAPASAEWKEKVLYRFQGGIDGATPTGAVVFDKAGNIYGATGDGGASTCDSPGQCGTVYQLAPPVTKGEAWTETVLYIFKGHTQNDGATPEGGLVIDQAGNLYGTTGYGGSGPCLLLGGAVGCGTVYELSPPVKRGDPWTETVLYSFQGGQDGYVASGDLVFDKAGNLYGATLFGGGKGTTCDSLYGGQCGTVFKLSPPSSEGGKWTEKVLHDFAGGTDGANPNGGLIVDSKAAIYGTTNFGGYDGGTCSSGGCGTVFKLKPPTKKGAAWIETVLHRFRGSPDGGGPAAGVTFDRSGDLFCTTLGGGGGNSPSGTVVQLTPRSGGKWAEKVLYSFKFGDDGALPGAGVAFDAESSLYGTATGGGTAGGGTIFRLRPTGNAWSFAVLHSFTGNPDGSWPASSLIFDAAGNLYGTTAEGGAGQGCGNYGCGTVFEVSP
jgi:uncharacterized repeat protein (TIGR03803 family)